MISGGGGGGGEELGNPYGELLTGQEERKYRKKFPLIRLTGELGDLIDDLNFIASLRHV